MDQAEYRSDSMNLLFIDTESTGRDPRKASLIEIGAFFTTDYLEKKKKFHAVVKCESANWEAGALNLHTKNGLIEDQDGPRAKSSEDVRESFSKFISSNREGDQWTPIYLVGTSVWADREVLNQAWGKSFMDELLGTHQVLDVTSLAIAFESQTGESAHGLLRGKEKSLMRVKHRALDDADYAFELYKKLVERGFKTKDRN